MSGAELSEYFFVRKCKKLSKYQRKKIKRVLYEALDNRGKKSIQSRLSFLIEMLNFARCGQPWRDLANWEAKYRRFRYWINLGIFERISEVLQPKNKGTYAIDSTCIRVHKSGVGALKKHGPQALGKSKGAWTTKIHALANTEFELKSFVLTGGHRNDCTAFDHLVHKVSLPARSMLGVLQNSIPVAVCLNSVLLCCQ